MWWRWDLEREILDWRKRSRRRGVSRVDLEVVMVNIGRVNWNGE